MSSSDPNAFSQINISTIDDYQVPNSIKTKKTIDNQNVIGKKSRNLKILILISVVLSVILIGCIVGLLVYFLVIKKSTAQPNTSSTISYSGFLNFSSNDSKFKFLLEIIQILHFFCLLKPAVYRK